MAYDTLVIQELGAEGAQFDTDIAATPMVAANGVDFDNVGGNILILIVNDGAAPQTATFKAVADPYGRTQDMDVLVANGKKAVAGPFTPPIWNQSDGKLLVDSATEDSFNFSAIRYRPL